ncbi:protein transport protein SEC31-like protein B [Cucumis melo var. makuwa]|uniref:Protein transport protein SEC31-like protein B n=1 Tax=Cucumis melo var. makuwa TaxID=1194695 RepID=A0A5A7SMD2_CUCMM|nr:protein transport protein SEC31-like protein B [Cucumis melo var. makuwa]
MDNCQTLTQSLATQFYRSNSPPHQSCQDLATTIPSSQSSPVFAPIVPRPRDHCTQFSIVPNPCRQLCLDLTTTVPSSQSFPVLAANHAQTFGTTVPSSQSCPVLAANHAQTFETTVPSSLSCPVLAATYESPTLKTTSGIIPLWQTTFNGFFIPFDQAAHRLNILFGLAGFEATELHGNLTQVQLLDALEIFRKQQVYFLISTDVAARDLMEKTIVLALATGQKRFSVTLCKFVEKCAEILASQGQLTMALEYVKLLGSEELTHELVILRD